MSDLPDRPDPKTSLVACSRRARLTLRAQVALKILIRERVQHDSTVLEPTRFAERVTARTNAMLTELERTGDVTYPPELQVNPSVPTMAQRAPAGRAPAGRVDAALNHASAVTGEFQPSKSPSLPAHEPPALVYSRPPSLPWDEHQVLARMLDRLVRLVGDRAATLTKISPVAVGLGYVTQPMLEALDGPLQERVDAVMAAVTGLTQAALEQAREPEPAPGPPTHSTLREHAPTGAKLVTTLVPPDHELILRPLPTEPANPPTSLSEAAERWLVSVRQRNAARLGGASRLGTIVVGPGQRETIFGVDLAAGPGEHVEAVFDPRTSPPTLVRLDRTSQTSSTGTTSSAPTRDETSRDVDRLSPLRPDVEAAGVARAALSEQGVLPQGPDERGDKVPDDQVHPSLELLRAELVAADLPPVEGLSPLAQALVTAAVRDVVGSATERALVLATGWPASLSAGTRESSETYRAEGALLRSLSRLAEVVSRYTDYEEDRDVSTNWGRTLLQIHSLPQCPDLDAAGNARLGAAVTALADVAGERAATAATLPAESLVPGAGRDAPGRRLLALREDAVVSALHELADVVADVVTRVRAEAVRSAGKDTAELLKMLLPRQEPDRPLVCRAEGSDPEYKVEPEWARAARTYGLDPQPPLVTRVAVPESSARPDPAPTEEPTRHDLACVVQGRTLGPVGEVPPAPKVEEPDPEHTLPTDTLLAECGGSWLLDLLVNMMDESATLVLHNRATPGYLNRVKSEIEAVRRELRRRVAGFPIEVRRTYTRIAPTTTLSDLTDRNLVSLTLQLCQDSTLSRVEPGGALGDPTEVSRDFGRASAELYSRLAQRPISQEPAPTSPLSQSTYENLRVAACDLCNMLPSDRPSADAAHRLLSAVGSLRPSAQEPAPTSPGEPRPGRTRVRAEGPPDRTTVQLVDELFRRVHDLGELVPLDDKLGLDDAVGGLKACIDELVLQAQIEAAPTRRDWDPSIDYIDPEAAQSPYSAPTPEEAREGVAALASAANLTWTQPLAPPIAPPTGTHATLVSQLVHRVDVLSTEIHTGSDPVVVGAWVDSVEAVAAELYARAQSGALDGAALTESQLGRALELAEAVAVSATRSQFTIQVLPHVDNLVDYLRGLADRATADEPPVLPPASRPDPILSGDALARVSELVEQLDSTIPGGLELLETQRACDALTCYLDELRLAAAEVHGPSSPEVPSTCRGAPILDDLLKIRYLACKLLDAFPRTSIWGEARRRAEAAHSDLALKINGVIATLTPES